MAAYISVPRDLSKVKSKIFFNLTKRQLICFSIAAAVGVPLFFLVKRGGNVSLAALTMIGVMLPFFFLAMYEKDGMPLEVILVLIRQYEAEKEVDEIVLHEERKAKGKRRAESSKVSQQKRP